MEHRSFDSPMDFEYENKSSRIPANSPWLAGTRTLQGNNNFKSPDKPNMAFQASRLNKALPETPIKNHVASFRENPALDFSSGGENPSSPEMGDNDDTPETNNRIKNLNDKVTVFRGNNHSPSKSIARPVSPTKFNFRNSISNWATKFSPSHKSIVRKDQSRQKREPSRPPKRKRRELHQGVALESEEEYEDDINSLATIQPPVYSPRKASHTSQEPVPVELGTVAAALKFINDHPTLPNTIYLWLQMVMNVFFMILAMCAIWSFYRAVQQEIELKATELGKDVLSEIARCTENFKDHNCFDREKLGATFRHQCDQWQTCMAQDWRAIGRARISMTIWAEIINSFVENLGTKIIGLGVVLFAIIVAVPNMLIGSARSKYATQHQPVPMSAPSMPNGEPFGQYQEQFFTPMHNRSYDAFSAQAVASGRRSPSKEHRAPENGSPVRRIQY